jgi:hypothetical protein
MPTSASDLIRRREKANAFCEAIRALDATGFSFFIAFLGRLYSLYFLYLHTSHELQLKVDCTWYYLDICSSDMLGL